MTQEESLFNSIGESIKDAERGQLFGKPCFKVNGKAFICFFQNEMVFKLPKAAVDEAMSLKGSKHFDPSGKGRPMKEWVQVSGENCDRWKAFTTEAFKYVEALKK